MLKNTLIQRSLKLTQASNSGVVYQLHRSTLNAAALREAAQALWQQIKHLQPQYLAAPGLGAAPIAAAIGQCALADGVVLETLAVRDPAKSRKNERLVEGFAPPAGQAVRMVFVDDTITQGSTYRATLVAVAQAGIAAQWVACAVLLDSWHPYGSRRIHAAGVPVFSALSRHDVGLTRDTVLAPVGAARLTVFLDLSAPLWVRHGLISKPEHPRKAMPVIFENLVIVALDDCSIRSYDLATGDERWVLDSLAPRSKGCGNALFVQPDGFMVVGLYDGTVTKLCARTGSVAWSRLVAMAIHSAPTVAGPDGQQVVYVSTEDRDSAAGSAARGRVVCLDYATGCLLWQTQLGDFAPSQTAFCYGFVAAAANNGSAFVLHAGDGSIRWQAKLPALARGKPLFYADSVIFACENGDVAAFDRDNGSLRWQTHASSGFDHSAPLLVDGCIVLLDTSMHLLALCPNTGALQWVHRLRGRGAWMPTQCGTNNDWLLTWTTEGHVALHHPASRSKPWETKTRGAKVFAGATPASYANKHLAKLCSDGRLVVFKTNFSA